MTMAPIAAGTKPILSLAPLSPTQQQGAPVTKLRLSSDVFTYETTSVVGRVLSPLVAPETAAQAQELRKTLGDTLAGGAGRAVLNTAGTGRELVQIGENTISGNVELMRQAVEFNSQQAAKAIELMAATVAGNAELASRAVVYNSGQVATGTTAVVQGLSKLVQDAIQTGGAVAGLACQAANLGATVTGAVLQNAASEGVHAADRGAAAVNGAVMAVAAVPRKIAASAGELATAALGASAAAAGAVKKA